MWDVFERLYSVLKGIKTLVLNKNVFLLTASNYKQISYNIVSVKVIEQFKSYITFLLIYRFFKSNIVEKIMLINRLVKIYFWIIFYVGTVIYLNSF